MPHAALPDSPAVFPSQILEAAALEAASARLFDDGYAEEALAAQAAAVALWRQRAPEATTLAAALEALARLCFDLGQHGEVLGLDGEAVALRRRLADLDPVGQSAALAAALQTQAEHACCLDAGVQALALAEEAVALRRRRAAHDPVGEAPALASALLCLAEVWAAQGRLDETQRLLREALRPVVVADAQRGPAAGIAIKAEALRRQLRQWEAAIRRAEADLAPIPADAAPNREALHRRAVSLGWLEEQRDRAGQSAGALEAARAHGAVCRRLRALDPVTSGRESASAHLGLARRLLRHGAVEEALSAVAEAVAGLEGVPLWAGELAHWAGRIEALIPALGEPAPPAADALQAMAGRLRGGV